MASETPRWVRALVGLAVTLLFVFIVQSRTDGASLFVGADQGAFWAEHLERLDAASQSKDVLRNMMKGDGRAVRTWIENVDRRFPPGLYLWGVVVGELVSHEAEVICRSMSLWWLLLALAAGLVSSCIADRARWSFVAGYAATLSLPGLGSLSLTYFFDLPMAALIWSAIAAWMLLDRWPPVAGVVAGAILFCAGLFKWTALPIGGLMLACTAAAGLLANWDRRRILWRVVGLGLAAATMVAAFWLWLLKGGTSFDHMMSITASATVFAEVQTWNIGPWTLTTVEWENRRLAWYVVRSVTHVLGPLSLIPFAIAAVWGARSHAGWLFLLIGVVHALFYVSLIPPLDGRFLMTAAPAGALLAATGWLRSGRRGAVLAAVMLLASGITLTEFHHGERNAWNRIWPADPAPGQALTGRGVFLEVGDRKTAGWPKAESTSAFIPGRDSLWEALVTCKPSAVLVPVDPFGRMTDSTWLSYRYRLARIRGEALPGDLLETGAVWGQGKELPTLPELPQRVLLLLGAVEQPPPAPGPGWTLQGRYKSADRNVSLWSRGEGLPCDLSLAFEQPPGDEPLQDGENATDEVSCQEADPGGQDLALATTARPRPLGSEGPCSNLDKRCAAPYLRAAERLNSEPGDCQEILAKLADARIVDRSDEAAEAWREGADWTTGQLSEALIDRLGLGDQRSLTTWGSPPQTVPGGLRQELVVEDELLGRQRIILYLPDGAGPHPAVVGLLGHDQSVEEFMREHAGQRLLEAGIALAVPIVRAYDSGEAENQATRAMLCAGSSMMAARVVETRNTLRLLRSRSEICPDRLGLLAHSGGSLIANLLAWIQPELRGIVTDMEGRYNGARESSPSLPPLLRDETHLGLRPLNLRLIAFDDAPVPTLRIRYGMPDGPDQVVNFLSEALRAEARVPQPPPLPPPQ